MQEEGPNFEPDFEDFSKWSGIINGPKGTPYEGGKFSIAIDASDEYPFKMPSVRFETKIWHPNICPRTGEIGICKDDWNPVFTLQKLIFGVQVMVGSPDINCPQNKAAAAQLTRSVKDFEETARLSTLVYASGIEDDKALKLYKERYFKARRDAVNFHSNTGAEGQPILPLHRNGAGGVERLDPLGLTGRWEGRDPEPGAPCRIVPLDPGGDEHRFVLGRLAATMPHAAASARVRRVESPGQLAAFEARAGAVRAACGADWDATHMVRWMFHGSARANLETIAGDPVFGFRALLARRTAHGDGIYFAEEAARSNEYAPDECVLLAAVVVGRGATVCSTRGPVPRGCHSFVAGRIVVVQVIP